MDRKEYPRPQEPIGDGPHKQPKVGQQHRFARQNPQEDVLW